MVSILILTKNEEQDLQGCLDSVSWCDDIHVLDSGSTDNTVAIARKFGALTAFHPFESFGKQRNYALDHLPFKHKWILFLDADERTTASFYNEVIHCLGQADEDTAGYYCCWKMILENRWLKRCDNYPKWQLRLLKKGMCRFKDFGHGQKEDVIKGKIKYIKQPYLHYSFSKGWSEWIAKHNQYSSKEAIERLMYCPSFKKVFSANSSMRNVALKAWLSRFPFWPLLRFIHTYIFNFGFFEGKQGLIYCCNMAYYEFLIQIKMREYRMHNKTRIQEIRKQTNKLEQTIVC